MTTSNPFLPLIKAPTVSSPSSPSEDGDVPTPFSKSTTMVDQMSNSPYSSYSHYSTSRGLSRTPSRATQSTSGLSRKKTAFSAKDKLYGSYDWDDDEKTECGGWDDDDKTSVMSSGFNKHTSNELSLSLGQDIVQETVETTRMPCAGTRIARGRLRGLMAWRLVVRLDDPSELYRAPSPGIVVNFILDTGSRHSIIPPEALYALGLRSVPEQGMLVKLIIQGVPTVCVIGAPGEAGRLCAAFMSDGCLAFYFDTRLVAPVLYILDSQSPDAPCVDSIQRTTPSGQTLRDKVLSLLSFGTRSKSQKRMSSAH